jgi:hypothetical protein
VLSNEAELLFWGQWAWGVSVEAGGGVEVVNERGTNDIDISGQGRPVLCFVMPKLWRGHRRAASAASLLYFSVPRHSGRYLELPPADSCEVLGELQECLEVFRLSE